MSNADLAKRYLSVLWHPCTQVKDHEWLPITPIRSGKGVWPEDYQGRRCLDAINSWWVNLFGHCNPRINAALAEQPETLEQVLLAGASREAVTTLSGRSVDITPAGMPCRTGDPGYLQ